MRRLLAATVVAGAAFGFVLPAHASVKCYGADAGGTHAGVCTGSTCTDECYVVLDPYCYHDARFAMDVCSLVN